MANRWTSHSFCNRFNLNLIVARAQMRDTPSAEGAWTVVFDHDRVMLDDARIEPRVTVRLARKFASIVRGGVTRFDQDDLF